MLAWIVLASACPLGPSAPQLASAEILAEPSVDSAPHVVADWNGDGRDDIAYATADGIFARESLADGSRGDAVSVHSAAALLYDLRASDVDGDGDPDLTFAEGSEAGWLANGGGTFAAFQPLITGLGTPVASFLVADVDADGVADVVYFDPAATPGTFAPLFLRKGNGDGTFGPASIAIPTSVASSRLRALDIDGDGDLDLALFRPGDPAFPGELEVALNDGSGGFTGSTGQVAVVLPYPASQIAFGDVDADGLQDLFVAVDSGTAARGTFVYPYLGGHAFGARTQIDDYAWLSNIVPTDVDQDGLVDVVVTSSALRPALWHRNLGGTFGVEQYLDPGTERVLARGVAVGDFDGDGWPDVEFRESDGDEVRCANRAGAPSDGYGHPVGNVLLQGPLLAAGDVDGDLRAEVLHLDWKRTNGTDEARLVRRQAGTRRADQEDVLYTWSGLQDWNFAARRPLVVGDLDGDGAQDAVVLILYVPTSGVSSLHLLRGTAGGGFAAPTQIQLTDASTGNPVSVWNDMAELVDLDGDGDLDLVVEAVAPPALRFCPGDGTGGFGPSTVLATPSSTTQFERPGFADLDGDGWLDAYYFLFSHAQTDAHSGLVVRRGQPGGGLGAEIHWSGTDRYRDLAHGDVDGDGVDELVGVRFGLAQGTAGGEVVWFPDPFTPTVAPVVVGSAPFAERFVVTDVDADGDGDVVALGSAGLDVFTRTAPGVFVGGRVQAFDAGDELSLLAIDLEGDGDQDLMWTSRADGGVGVVENLSLGGVGTLYCSPAVPNSTGAAGRIRATGSSDVSVGRLRLIADRLPAASGTLFVTSDTAAAVPGVGGLGTLCLGGAIGRFNAPGQFSASSAAGVTTLDVDLSALPRPNGSVSVVPGDTWRFTAWFRDFAGGVQTSNFTDAVAVTFL